MVRVLLVLLLVAVWLRLFTFRHVYADDPTVTLFAAAWPGWAYRAVGPVPTDRGTVAPLLSGENGFAGEELYLALVPWGWAVLAGALLVAMLLRRS